MKQAGIQHAGAFARRRSLGGTLLLAGLAGCLAAPWAGRAALDPEKDKLFYVVANSHLDTQWNWTIQSSIYPYLSNTLSGNFAHFTNYPNYLFNFEGSFRYQLAKEYYPEYYETLKHFIAQGRWRVAGSSVDAGDVNIPSPESLMRHILYGNHYFQREFSKTSTDIFLPDCFGFTYALPSIAAHCGLTGFSTAKLHWGSAIPFPFQNIGRWVGPDGASVMAVISPGAYDSGIFSNLAESTNYLARITNMAAATGLNLDFRYYGTGDIGGAPKAEYVEWMEKSVTASNAPIRVLSAGADQLFRDLTPAQVARLPAYQGEFLMRIHGVGCYTAHSEMKTYNRRNELAADAAERAAVMADWLQGGGTYPQERLTRAWERFLWHQFHDDLTGTSIDAAYNFSWNDELLSLKDFAAEQVRGMGVVAQALDTTAEGVPLVVYNPLALEREDVVEAVVEFPTLAPKAVRVFDREGKEVPAQIGEARGRTLPVTFLARLPSAGVAVFDVRPSTRPCGLNTGLAVSASQLENPRYRVRLNGNGDVSSIYDKRSGRELLKSPIRWAFLYNLSTAWPAWEITYASLMGTATFLGGPTRVEIIEQGPARVAVAVRRFKDGSEFTERIRLAGGEAGDRVEWDVSVNWGSRKTLLKATFPLAVNNSLATYDLGLGTIERGNNKPSLYEVPAQQWADLTDSNGTYGVSILNDSKYGWDKTNDSTLRFTVFHTPEAGATYPHGAENSIGQHRLSFAVMGHTNDWRQGQTPWAAARLNQPLQAFQTAAHAGALGKALAFLTLNNSNVMVKAIKKAEDSDEIVVRLQELTGRPQFVELTAVTDITAAREMNGAEAALGPLTPAAGKLTVALTGYQPKTLALTLAAAGSTVAKTESLPLTLPFNLDVVSGDANRTDGNFDGGITYPAELMPVEFQQEGVTFRLGPTNDGALNAVACEGQTIALAGSNQTYLYFLAAAAGEDATANFLVDGKATEVNVQSFTGFVGQWKPPLHKPAAVGRIFTHRHLPQGNDPYRFCYLFKYRLEVPPGAKTLTLPQAPHIRVFAVSLARDGAVTTQPAGGALAANEHPWADAGANQQLNTTGGNTALVTLDASRSRDPDGRIVSYLWSDNGARLATGVTSTVKLGVGTHRILLTVMDDQGGVGHDLITVTIARPLRMKLGATPAQGAVPLMVQFMGQAEGETGGMTAADGTGTVTAQGEFLPNELARRLFDNNPTTKWLDFAETNPATRASWVQYQFALGRRPIITNYVITAANDFPARDPQAWRLLASNDGTNWMTLDTRTNETFATRSQRRAFGLNNSTGYNYFRWQIDRVADPETANAVQVAELELIGDPVHGYLWNFGDGTVSTEQNPRHEFTNDGNYLVTLAAEYAGQTGTNQALITVGPPLTVAGKGLPLASGLALQFSATATGGNLTRTPLGHRTAGEGIVTASGDNAPLELAAHAFDSDPQTKWLDFAKVFPHSPTNWIQYRYAGDWPHVVTRYALTSANDSPERDPRDWRLLGSRDGTNWLTLDARSNEAFTNRFERREFGFANTNAYPIYRLEIDATANPAIAGSVQLGDIEWIGNPDAAYRWNFGDGTASTEASPQHTYVRPGSYPVTVSVSDGTASVTNRFELKVTGR